jgi:hypothetical protein
MSTDAKSPVVSEPIDWKEVERWARLSPGQRIQALLDARELAAGLIRGRLRRRYPDLDDVALNMKLLAELERGNR